MKKVEVFQISNNVEGAHYLRFTRLSTIKEMGITLTSKYYNSVFNGELDCEDAEDVFMLLNIGRKPEGYKGHSLSVSDVIVMDGKALFCDSCGFQDISATFFA